MKLCLPSLSHLGVFWCEGLGHQAVEHEGADWGGENQFDSTELLSRELLKDVTLDVEKQIQEEAEIAEIREDMKSVGFLQALPEVVRSDTDDQTAIGKMQAFKEREPEEVRWRSVSKHAGDVNLLTKFENMLQLVYQNPTLVDLDVLLPGSASEVNVVNFIGEAHHRSLKVSDLKQEENHNSRTE